MFNFVKLELYTVNYKGETFGRLQYCIFKANTSISLGPLRLIIMVRNKHGILNDLASYKEFLGENFTRKLGSIFISN